MGNNRSTTVKTQNIMKEDNNGGQNWRHHIFSTFCYSLDRGLQMSSLYKEPTVIQNYLGATTSGPFRSSWSFCFSANKLTGRLSSGKCLSKTPNPVPIFKMWQQAVETEIIQEALERASEEGAGFPSWAMGLNFLDILCPWKSILVMSLCKQLNKSFSPQFLGNNCATSSACYRIQDFPSEMLFTNGVSDYTLR